MKKKVVSIGTILLTAILAACDSGQVNNDSSNSESNKESSCVTYSESETESSSLVSPSSQESESSEVQEYPVNDNFKFPTGKEASHPTVETMSALPAYTPITFNKDTYSKTKLYSVVDGLDINRIQVKLNTTPQRSSTCYIAEMDLAKVNIVAGSYNNTTSSNFTTKSIPTAMADAWERDNPGKKALLAINADYFGDTCVNAFVKDGVILKNSHIDDINDLPVSSPMLFGVSTAGARIGAMTTTGNRTTDYTSKLYYGSCVDLYDENGTSLGYKGGGNTNAANKNTSFAIIDKAGVYSLPAGMMYKFKKLKNSKEGAIQGCIVEVIELPKVKGLRVTADETSNGYGYFTVGKLSGMPNYEVGTYFQQTKYLASPSETWDYYDTILGCRHSLIENGILPSTLAKETSNGASTCAARTSVGIMPNGHVVMFAVEDFIRNPSNANCNGLNLTQVADIMRYYGVYDAANFDGGGSTQLTTKLPSESWKVVVRSSDYQTYTVTSTRKVLNAFIVTTK